jgi:hypothetical protein
MFGAHRHNRSRKRAASDPRLSDGDRKPCGGFKKGSGRDDHDLMLRHWMEYRLMIKPAALYLCPMMSRSQLLAGTCVPLLNLRVYITLPDLFIASQDWLQDKECKNFLFLPKVVGPAVICESNIVHCSFNNPSGIALQN